MDPVKRTLATLVTLLLVALSLSACASSTTPSPAPPPTSAPASAAKAAEPPAASAPTKVPAAATSANSGGTLTVALEQDAKSLDPAVTTDIYSGQVVAAVFSSLVYVDYDGNIVPGVAKSWNVSADGLTWDFTLADNVKFQDGSKLTADDVLYSFQRILDPALKSPIAGRLAGVDTMKAVDPTHFQVTLKKPAAPFLYDLTTIYIVPKAVVEKMGTDFGKKPIGSGPFKFTSWLEGDQITIERFNDYFLGAPKLAKIVFRVIPDASVRLVELETGGVDLATSLAASDLATLASKPDIGISKTPGTNYRFWAMNVTKPPFDNVKVRQAVAYAIDRQKIIDMVYPGVAVPAAGPFPSVCFVYDPNFKGIQYDPAKAKQLLADAGYSNGFEVEALISNDDVQAKEGALLVEQLAAVGITVKIKTLDFSTLLDAMVKGNYQMGRMGWSPAPDPNSYVAVPFGSDSLAGYNFPKYSNPKADDLIAKGATTMDTNQRKQIYQQLQQLLVDDSPVAFVFHEVRAVAYNKRVIGFKTHPTGTFYFNAPFGADVSVAN